MEVKLFKSPNSAQDGANVTNGDTEAARAADALELLSHIVSKNDGLGVTDWVINQRDRDRLSCALDIARTTITELQKQLDAEVLEQIENVKHELALLEKMAA